jgi:HemY protein
LADHAKQQGDLKTALTYAEEAYELAQDKRDIVFLYVYLLRQLKGEKAAQSVVEQTWAISPDPRLAKLYLEITHPDSDQNKMKMIKRLASFAPHNPESFLATAHAAIDVKLWDEARELLSQLIADGYGTEEILKLSSRLENIAYS